MIISYRVTIPVDSITNYLKCENQDPPLYTIQKSFNSQINSIIESLKHIEDIEKFIDPSFLLIHDYNLKKENLTSAKKLFESIQHKRGVSIVCNLLGNAEFAKKKYKEAENYYQESLSSLEDLLKEIEEQEKQEKELARENKGKNSSKKKKLTESIILKEN